MTDLARALPNPFATVAVLDAEAIDLVAALELELAAFARADRPLFLREEFRARISAPGAAPRRR